MASWPCAAMLTLACAASASSAPGSPVADAHPLHGVAAPVVAVPPVRQVREVDTPAGRVRFDLYRTVSATADARPLVVVAHGFSRSRAQMAGWGRHLAAQGYVVAVPDLPAWSDHARNGRALNGLVASLLAHPPDGVSLDHDRVALIGFSAGGLATLLAAADDTGVCLWVGLDPVDRDGLGARAAGRLRARAVVLQAEPSACNARGNARDLIAALGARATVARVPNATHVDAEWPTSLAARMACGGSDEARRQAFVRLATDALAQAFAEPAAGPRPERPPHSPAGSRSHTQGHQPGFR